MLRRIQGDIDSRRRWSVHEFAALSVQDSSLSRCNDESCAKSSTSQRAYNWHSRSVPEVMILKKNLSDTCRRAKTGPTCVVKLQPSDDRIIKGGSVEMRVIDAGHRCGRRRSPPHNPCHSHDMIGSLRATPSPSTECATRLKMEEGVHDISIGLLAAHNFRQRTYMLSISGGRSLVATSQST